jgi:hypothetical protein
MELLDALPIRANLSGVATDARRAALYVRVSTSGRGQTVENQLAPLQEAAGRLGWTVVAVYRDEGISGLGWSPINDRLSEAPPPRLHGNARREPPFVDWGRPA